MKKKFHRSSTAAASAAHTHTQEKGSSRIAPALARLIEHSSSRHQYRAPFAHRIEKLFFLFFLVSSFCLIIIIYPIGYYIEREYRKKRDQHQQRRRENIRKRKRYRY
jgi:hypothetical protein